MSAGLRIAARSLVGDHLWLGSQRHHLLRAHHVGVLGEEHLDGWMKGRHRERQRVIYRDLGGLGPEAVRVQHGNQVRLQHDVVAVG